jgi:predicted secreted protein
MYPFLIIPLFLALLSTQALAGSDDAQYNRVSLNESAQIEVDNDLLVVIMFAQAEGRDPAAPADEVNRRMDWAVNMVKSHPEVKVQTLGYQTSPLYNKSTIRGWRVNQSLRLESRDGRLLGDLVGRLQEQLQMQSIAYQVSEGQRREKLDGLTAQALARFQDRAAHIAKTLGRSGYRVVRININDGRHGPMPIARGMMMEASADVAVAPPRLEAGTQQMSVSIDGEIELSEQ